MEFFDLEGSDTAEVEVPNKRHESCDSLEDECEHGSPIQKKV
jgi:hypothetical protein